jgi:hypothetical protein
VSSRPNPQHCWHSPMQWQKLQGRRVSCPETTSTVNDPTPSHFGQRPDPLHALQIAVAISLTPCETWKGVVRESGGRFYKRMLMATMGVRLWN